MLPWGSAIPPKVVIIIGLAVLCVGGFLTGPSHLLHFRDSLELLKIGLATAGFGKGLALSFHGALAAESLLARFG